MSAKVDSYRTSTASQHVSTASLQVLNKNGARETRASVMRKKRTREAMARKEVQKKCGSKRAHSAKNKQSVE